MKWEPLNVELTPSTPSEYKRAIYDMRMSNPFVHRACTMQEIENLTLEDMLAVLAYHVIKSHEAMAKAQLDLLRRMPIVFIAKGEQNES